MWWQSNKNLPAKRTPPARRAQKRPRPYRPQFERLEDRWVPTVFVVSSNGDSGLGTLRQAIMDANAHANSGGLDIIAFALAPGSTTIAPTSALPAITDPVFVAGLTQPGSSAGTPLVELSGVSAGAADGLTDTAGGSVIQGLVVDNWQGNGIVLGANGDLFVSNFIGLDVTGAATALNTGAGILVVGTGNVIGGTTPDLRNVIGGSPGVLLAGAGNVVEGNFIGVRSDGTALPTGTQPTIGVEVVAAGNTIGGTAGAGNVISGNSTAGVISASTGTVVQGNLIGTNAAGSAGLGGQLIGVLDAAGGMTLGGTTAGAGNTISGNGLGVLLSGSGASVVQGNLIGTDITGATAVPNSSDGINVSSSGNTIGGTDTGAGNFISGNGADGILLAAAVSGNVVEGNIIGLSTAGTALGNAGSGVEVQGTGNTIGGTAAGARNFISGNAGTGVLLNGGSGNVVQGNFIGTNAAGNAAVPNGLGVAMLASGNTVGGATAGAGNVISGNVLGGVVDNDATGVLQGNFIGTDSTGATGVGNLAVGVTVQVSGVTVGGTATGAGNVISGNASDGVLIATGAGTGVVLQGNLIGTNATGSAALGNGANGVNVQSAGNTIGGTAAGAGNTISANGADGILLAVGAGGGGANVVQGNFIGTNSTGAAALGNKGQGVDVQSANNAIGGTTAGARNIISGNSNNGVLITVNGAGTIVQGNFIGTDATGAVALGNGLSGIEVDGNGNVIGGAGGGNVVSGNAFDGVLVFGGNANLVASNLIGTNAAGSAALGNGAFGVLVSNGGSANTIGGTDPSLRNIISGNAMDGIGLVFAGGNVIQGNYVGTDSTGAVALGNQGRGILVGGQGNLIGGTAAGAGNVVSGNVGIGILLTASGNIVQGNFVGTDATGNAALGNGTSGAPAAGIAVFATGNVIGGTDPGAGNVVSGNTSSGIVLAAGSDGTVVEGNRIGTNAAGTAAVGNQANGVDVFSTGITIGGTSMGAGNVISGNTMNGIVLENGADGTQVQGNFIGTDATGAVAVANGTRGIEIDSATNTIGGTAAGARNIISGNAADGILVTGASGAATNNAILGNFIGTDAAGSAALANGGNGIAVLNVSGTLIGAPGGGNVISGNAMDGILLSSAGSSVAANLIGTDATGTSAIGNTIGGVLVEGNGNLIGAGFFGAAGNTISGNTGYGVTVADGFAGNIILANLIGTNSAGDTALGNGGDGVVVNGTSNTIGEPGFANVISGNQGNGVLISQLSAGGGSSNIVQFNRIGTDATGATAIANHQDGVLIQNGSNNVVVGNTISGNGMDGVGISGTGTGNLVQTNLIGTDATGATAVGNAGAGVHLAASSNTIGGTAAGTGNIISGNLGDGVLIDTGANSNIVAGNLIGTDATGTKALGNGINGVDVLGSQNQIGASGGTGGNTISANTGDGVLIEASGTGNLVVGNRIGTDVTGTMALGNSLDGVHLAGSTNTIGTPAGGLNVISGNKNDGVLIDVGATGNVVQSNRIGTDALGATALPNGGEGVEVSGSNNTIGGTASGASNQISGNTGDGVLLTGGGSGNLVEGNLIGTDASGGTALGNGMDGVRVESAGNTVGGSSAAARNIISGNLGNGVSALAAVVLEGNYIGTDVTGNTALGNQKDGVLVQGTGITVGGIGAGLGNVISGNVGDGVLISSSGGGSNAVLGNLIGTNAGGTSAIPNGLAGVEVQTANNTIGASGGGNTISGNTGAGVLIDGAGATGNVVASNGIGVGSDGTTAVGNGSDGVRIDSASTNTIGGTTAGSANQILANTGNGVQILGATATGNVVEGNQIGNSGLGNKGDGVLISGAPANTVGGTATGAGNTIQANANDGVRITGGAATGNLVEGNLIGQVSSGGGSLGNGADGVGIEAPNNTVGGTDVAARNVISGNAGWGVRVDGSVATGALIEGNYIGTETNGTGPVGNHLGGVSLETGGNTVGGTAMGAGNVISGNLGDGVHIQAQVSGGGSGIPNLVQGNFIGTDATGASSLGNSGNGVTALSAATIGGTAMGARNVISANNSDGVLVMSTDVVVQDNNIGTNAAGTSSLGNRTNGVEVRVDGITMGAAPVVSGNLISGNQQAGVSIQGSGGATPTVVQGNLIGTDATGASAIGNQTGVVVNNAAATIGGTGASDGNTISGNLGDGIDVTNQNGAGSPPVTIQGNRIGTDATGAVALGNGGNGIALNGHATVGGTAAGTRNIISGNTQNGLLISDGGGATANVIQGNFIGTDLTGAKALGNGMAGIKINFASNNTIGGTEAGEGNLISGNNQDGILMNGDGATGNVVQGNMIGVAADGTSRLGNIANGVFLTNFAANNMIGVAETAPPAAGSTGPVLNTIAFNGNDGVLIGSDPARGLTAAAGTGNAVLTNSIYSNGKIGIDLGPNDGPTPNDSLGHNGPNNFQNTPILTSALSSDSATVVTGTLTSTPSTTFTIQFFADLQGVGSAQAKTFLGSTMVTTDGTGMASFSVMLPVTVPQGQVVTATATDANNNTSELASAPTTVTPWIVTGVDAGAPPEVKVYEAGTRALKYDIMAYNSQFTGGVRVAVGDVNGDGVPDIITVPGSGGGPDVRVFDGKTGMMIKDFMAYDPSFTGGLFVASADLNQDGFADIVIGADAGTVPAGSDPLEVFSGKDGSVLFHTNPFPTFAGGVRVAAGDVNSDGVPDIVAAAGPGGGPQVIVFEGLTGQVQLYANHPGLLRGFYAFDPSFSGGVYVAVGDTTGTGRDDIIVSAGAGGGPAVKVFDGTTLDVQQYPSQPGLTDGFYAYDPSFTGGARVAAVDVNGDGRVEIIVGPGPASSAQPEKVIDSITLAEIDMFFAYGDTFTKGVFVGAAR
jgi:hypothetical protein